MLDQSCSRMSAPISPPPVRRASPADASAILRIALSLNRDTPRPLVPLMLPLKQAERRADHLAGVLVLARGDLDADERVQLGREGDVTSLIRGHSEEPTGAAGLSKNGSPMPFLCFGLETKDSRVLSQNGEADHGGEVDGELLVAGCDRAAGLEPAHTAFNKAGSAVEDCSGRHTG